MTLLDILSAIGGVFGILYSLNKGYILFKKWKQRRVERKTGSFKGKFDNMGQRTFPPPYYLDLDTYGYGKHFEGKFNFRLSIDENSWEMLEIEGIRSAKKLKCKLFKNFGCGKILVGSGILIKKDH